MMLTQRPSTNQMERLPHSAYHVRPACAGVRSFVTVDYSSHKLCVSITLPWYYPG